MLICRLVSSIKWLIFCRCFFHASERVHGSGGCRGQFTDPPMAKPERNETKHAKGAINQPPPERDAAQGAEHECIGDHHGAGDQAKSEEPAVADRVTEGADESDGDDEMTEGQPVGAVE